MCGGKKKINEVNENLIFKVFLWRWPEVDERLCWYTQTHFPCLISNIMALSFMKKWLAEYLSCEFKSCFPAAYQKARGDTLFLVFCSQRRQKCYSCGKCKPGRRWGQGGGRKYVKCLKSDSVNILFPLPMPLKSRIFRPTDKAKRELFVSTRKARTYFWRLFNFKWGALSQQKQLHWSSLKYC